MLGVHGNGLTHLIWMPATPRSAVIEMYIRGGFARDCKSFLITCYDSLTTRTPTPPC